MFVDLQAGRATGGGDVVDPGGGNSIGFGAGSATLVSIENVIGSNSTGILILQDRPALAATDVTVHNYFNL